MDFCRNVSVSSGLPSEYPSEQVISPAYSIHNGVVTNYNSASLDDLFPIQNTEGDVSLEWLSAFVEDCLSSTGNCIPAAPTTTTLDQAKPNLKPTIATTITQITPKPCENIQRSNTTTPPSLQTQRFTIPGKARSKIRRRSSIITTSPAHLHKKTQPFHHVISSDPPLLHQAYWLADSELILPKKMDNSISSSNGDDNEEEEERSEEEEEEKMMVMMKMGGGGGGGGDSNEDNLVGSMGSIENSHGQPRRCTHCLSQRTPQWRAGPLGPKTLCNACGVRYKSGRLLPEYRPAKSPTFVSYKHSNSHKKVMEMRMSVPSSTTTTTTDHQ